VVAVPLLMSASEFSYTPRAERSPAGRYYGLKQVGPDPYGYQSLELVIDAKGGATLVWARRDQTDERERKTLPLADVKVTEAGVSATVTGARPAEVPAKLSGKFVTRVPPPNAKGALRDGVLFGRDWFLEVERPAEKRLWAP
jgi:hypothetical protein